MVNLGNISNIVYTSYPSKWDEVHVCHDCKVKKSVRVWGERLPDHSKIDGYMSLDNVSNAATGLSTSTICGTSRK